MVSTTNSIQNFTRIVRFYTSFSTIYLTVLIFLLFYHWDIYQIGKLTSLPLIIILAVVECIKYKITNIMNIDKPKIKKYKTRFKSLLLILGMVVVYYVVAVLFGAAFLSNQEETLMLSVLLSVLTILPTCLNLGFDVTAVLLTSLTTYQGDLLVECIKRNIFLTLFGTWLGAVVIPLDWDRPWQVWPIPCSIGAIMGYYFSHILVLLQSIIDIDTLFAKHTGKYGL